MARARTIVAQPPALALIATLAACSSGSATPADAGKEPSDAAGAPSNLTYAAGCSATDCPAPQGGLPLCTRAEGAACAWTNGVPHGGTSFAPCDEATCGARPEPTCPEGYVARAPACAALDGAACGWTYACAPPPFTTPCDRARCGPEPASATICDGPDGGVPGTRACREGADGSCGWQLECP